MTRIARSCVVVVIAGMAMVQLSCRGRAADQPVQHYGVGRPTTRADIAAVDIDVGPDGAGLPPGSGTAEQGRTIYLAKCASCHGARGEGLPPNYPRLIGRDSIAEGFPFARDPRLERTIGNYWPYATTVFGYIRRAMPATAPGSLSDDQVYALTAWLLAANRIVPDNATMDSAALSKVTMPYRNRFVPDDRRGGREVR